MSTISTILTETELDEIYSFAIQLAKEAGQKLLDAVDARLGQTSTGTGTTTGTTTGGGGGGAVGHVEKESAVDLVTETDEGE